MGVVWRAEDDLLGREVALKRVGLTPGGTSPDIARAEREARLAATLSHPNVVSVFDLAQHGDEQWLVMEYVESATLGQLVRDHGPLPPDSAARLLCQAADALAAAHAAGIVHRDVKPSNILVSPTGHVKLTDFGIARGHADVTLTATGLMTGSPAYLAPEVASGSTATQASDVWALGATLYHALTGEPPYEVAGNVVGALYRIVHEEPPRPRDAGWLAPLLEATMAKDPKARWSMPEVAQFLARGGACGPFTERPEPERTAVLAPVPETREAGPAPAARRAVGKPAAVAAGGRGSAGQGFAGRRPGGGRLAALLLGVAAVVAATYLGWAVLAGGADDGRRTASAAENPSAAGSPASGVSEETAGSRPTEEEMEGFAGDYVATVTVDPAAAWERLTPRFQELSGGFGGYRSWWSRIDSARVTSASADPEAMTVSYAVTYEMTDGSTTTDEVTLELTTEDGELLISGER
jgi:hypothetical protein